MWWFPKCSSKRVCFSSQYSVGHCYHFVYIWLEKIQYFMSYPGPRSSKLFTKIWWLDKANVFDCGFCTYLFFSSANLVAVFRVTDSRSFPFYRHFCEYFIMIFLESLSVAPENGGILILWSGFNRFWDSILRISRVTIK